MQFSVYIPKPTSPFSFIFFPKTYLPPQTLAAAFLLPAPPHRRPPVHTATTKTFSIISSSIFRTPRAVKAIHRLVSSLAVTYASHHHHIDFITPIKQSIRLISSHHQSESRQHLYGFKILWRVSGRFLHVVFRVLIFERTKEGL